MSTGGPEDRWEGGGGRRRLFVFDTVHPLTGPESRSEQAADDGPRALLCGGGVIQATGTARRLRRENPDARAVEFRDATATPGLADGHIHLLEWALDRRQVDLGTAGTPAEAAELLARRAGASEGGWVRGHGWRPDAWDDLPHRSLLDREVPERPVALRSHDMHAWWLNSRALRELEICRDTPDPPGGEIVRDREGVPTGVLLEAAGERVSEALDGETTTAEKLEALEAAQARLHRRGVTRVHSMEMPSPTFDSLDLLSRMEAEGTLRLRVLQHLPVEWLEEAVGLGLRSGYGSNKLKVGCAKSFLDGTLGCRSAWMHEPYEDAEHRGDRLLEAGELRRRVELAAGHGLATAVHAIGDAAVEQAMEALSSIPAGPGGGEGVPILPHRVEHAEMVTDRALARGDPRWVVCSVQPAHLLTDRQAAIRRWGRERCRRAFRFRSLRTRGFRLVFGSDAPVEEPDPLLAMKAAVERGEGADGTPGAWNAGERLSRAAALRALTVEAARSGGTGDPAGRLVAGAPADFVAWRGDPLDPDVALPDGPECVCTVVGGEPVWTAADGSARAGDGGA